MTCSLLVILAYIQILEPYLAALHKKYDKTQGNPSGLFRVLAQDMKAFHRRSFQAIQILEDNSAETL